MANWTLGIFLQFVEKQSCSSVLIHMQFEDTWHSAYQKSLQDSHYCELSLLSDHLIYFLWYMDLHLSVLRWKEIFRISFSTLSEPEIRILYPISLFQYYILLSYANLHLTLCIWWGYLSGLNFAWINFTFGQSLMFLYVSAFHQSVRLHLFP